MATHQTTPTAPLPQAIAYVVDHGTGPTAVPTAVARPQATDTVGVVGGTTPARIVPQTVSQTVCQGYGANTLRRLPGRTSRSRARGRSGVRPTSTRTAEGRSVSGGTRRQRREARAIAHRLHRDRGSTA